MDDAGGAPPTDAAVISRRMVTLLRDASGRGPTKARTTIGRDHVLVVFQDTLTPGERNLVEHGMEAEVSAVRRGYQEMMKDRAIAMIEERLDRRVLGFMSTNHFDPDLAAEVFILDPTNAQDDQAPEEAEAQG